MVSYTLTHQLQLSPALTLRQIRQIHPSHSPFSSLSSITVGNRSFNATQHRNDHKIHTTNALWDMICLSAGNDIVTGSNAMDDLLVVYNKPAVVAPAGVGVWAVGKPGAPTTNSNGSSSVADAAELNKEDNHQFSQCKFVQSKPRKVSKTRMVASIDPQSNEAPNDAFLYSVWQLKSAIVWERVMVLCRSR